MPKPMTVGILGTGEVAAKAAISLLEDLTEVHDPLHFVFAADQANWTSIAQDIAEFIADNEVTFDLIVDDDADPGQDYLDAAQSVVKVARPGIGVVRQLERAEGEKRLVVLFSEDDEDGLKAIERAIDKGITALDLTSGLEPLVFGDDDTGPSDDAGTTEEAPVEEAAASEEPPKRKRRTKAEMEAARAAEAAASSVEEEPADEQPADDGGETAEATTPDLGTEEDWEAAIATTSSVTATNDWVRGEALSRALSHHHGEGEASEVVKTAYIFLGFLTDSPVQTTPGRPRADGSPAQPRERDDEGKPVRRRRASS